MIPLKDDNPRSRFPIVNTLIIVVNVVVFVHQAFLPEVAEVKFVYQFGAIPANIVHGDALLTILTSLFLHGGIMHIAGNMLYLFVFGDNIENLMGPFRYLGFYLLCGVVATLSHVFVAQGSEVPLVGASGAISGVLGAYAVTYPRARVLVAVPIVFYITTFRLPAVFVLGLWFLTQLISGFTSLGVAVSGGVAWFAHIGGFVVGVLLVWLFKRRRREPSIEYYDFD